MVLNSTDGLTESANTRGFEDPRAAYVHVPFCAHRCGYCNFTLVAGRDDLIDRYLQALEHELQALSRPRPIDTLFLGGGTPTHLSPDALQSMLRIVTEWFPLRPGGEFSVEANPIDVTEERIALLADAGVTRMSLGAQSFDTEKLALLERDHDAQVITRAAQLAQQAFHSLSLDLIFAAPGEKLTSWQRDLEFAIELRPDHISTYGLTYEQGTSFWSRRAKGELASLPEETERAMYEASIDRLTSAGYEHYEVSNFAQPGHRCRHNEVYWTGATFYAAGPGAARYVAGCRSVNHRSTLTWMNRVLAAEDPIMESETLDAEQRLRERLVFGLRRLEGVNLQALATEFGLDVRALIVEPLDKALQHGLLEQHGDLVRLTREGLLLSDSIATELL